MVNAPFLVPSVEAAVVAADKKQQVQTAVLVGVGALLLLWMMTPRGTARRLYSKARGR